MLIVMDGIWSTRTGFATVGAEHGGYSVSLDLLGMKFTSRMVFL